MTARSALWPSIAAITTWSPRASASSTAWRMSPRSATGAARKKRCRTATPTVGVDGSGRDGVVMDVWAGTERWGYRSPAQSTNGIRRPFRPAERWPWEPFGRTKPGLGWREPGGQRDVPPDGTVFRFGGQDAGRHVGSRRIVDDSEGRSDGKSADRDTGDDGARCRRPGRLCAGVSKRWVLSPIGDAFGDLTPNGKVIVTALIVVGTIVLIALSRHTRRTAVTAARRRIDEAHGTGR